MPELPSPPPAEVDFPVDRPPPAKIDNERKRQFMDRLEKRRALYETFARRGDFGVEFGNKTAFDHDSANIIIGAEQLMQMGIENDQDEVDFIVGHELGHMRELYDDPDGYARIIKEGDRDDGLGHIYFRLYNCLMDIYVNTNNRNRWPVYREGQHFSSKVVDLYKEKTFSKRDFTDNPLAVQFSDYLLNLGMDAGDDIQLAPETQQAIGEGVTYAGEHFTYQELIDTFMRPALDKGNSYQATASQRKSVIDRTIRPVFERLLEIDKKKGADMDKFKDQSVAPGKLKPGDFKDALDDAKKKKAEREMTPEERAKRERDRQTGQMASEGGLNENETHRFKEMFERMQPTIYELVRLWKQMRKVTTTWEVEKTDTPHKSGADLLIKEVIKQYPEIQKRPQDVPVWQRREYKERKMVQPRDFVLYVAPDLSGSMEGDIERLQELSVSLASSLSIINAEAKINKEEAVKMFKCYLNLIGFSDSAIPILENNDDVSMLDLMKSFKKIHTVGGTSDHTALDHINKSLTPDVAERIKSGDLIGILVEITDGDTSNPQESIRLIDEIESKGVITIGIKLGYGVRLDKTSEKPGEDMEKEREASTRDTFGQIFNRGGKKRGYRINKSEEVIPTFYQALKKVIEVKA